MRRASQSFLCGLIGAAIATAAFAQVSDAAWYQIVAGAGEVLGHASHETVPTATGRDVIDSQQIYLQEQGSAATIATSRTVFSEDHAGHVLAISATSHSGASWSRIDTHISGGAAHIQRETPAGRWTTTVALPLGVRFDDGDALLRTWSPAATPRLEFANFNIDAMAVERIVIEAAPNDPQGRTTALRRRYDGEALVGIARLTLDAEGRIVDVGQSRFGDTIIHMRATDQATALRPHRPYQLVPNTMTRSPFRIPDAATQGHIRYVLSYRDGIAFALPQTGEQRAIMQADAATIDICADCGPGLPSDPAYLADALRPTAWLQSDHPRLHAIADPVARLDVTDARKMEILIARARPYLGRIDYSGHYSALDTLQRRAGDCTEAAVLLAALGRAAGIPTRVVSGLTYSRESYHGVANAFMPHSWTLAWVDGAWRSFDLALDQFDSTHIALTVGDGDARSVAAAAQLASLLRFDSLAEVRTRAGS